MQIVIPAAGRGSRFNDSEFIKPKPLIEWNNKNMIQHVIDNFKGDNKIIIIKRDIHELKCEDDIKIINIDYTTDGPACTANLSKDLINIDTFEEFLPIIENSWNPETVNKNLILGNNCSYLEFPCDSYLILPDRKMK
jgi:hypothetical protein